MDLSGKLNGVGEMTGYLSGSGVLSGGMTIPEKVSPPTYEGPYEFTPTEAPIILEGAGLVLGRDVTINPIPANYGLVTYNGVYLRIS